MVSFAQALFPRLLGQSIGNVTKETGGPRDTKRIGRAE